ncbi:unnamed protein product [Sphagnum tenellum]
MGLGDCEQDIREPGVRSASIRTVIQLAPCPRNAYPPHSACLLVILEVLQPFDDAIFEQGRKQRRHLIPEQPVLDLLKWAGVCIVENLYICLGPPGRNKMRIMITLADTLFIHGHTVYSPRFPDSPYPAWHSLEAPTLTQALAATSVESFRVWDGTAKNAVFFWTAPSEERDPSCEVGR